LIAEGPAGNISIVSEGAVNSITTRTTIQNVDLRRRFKISSQLDEITPNVNGPEIGNESGIAHQSYDNSYSQSLLHVQSAAVPRRGGDANFSEYQQQQI
jgi:hypothetical protein